MKFLPLVLIAFCSLSLGACKDSQPTAQQHSANNATPTAELGQDATTQGMSQQLSGTIMETMDTAGYTYVKVKTADKEIWAAAPEFKTAVGESVIIPAGMIMPDYHSNTLNRDFDELYFVSSIINPNADMDMSPHAMGEDQQAAMSTSAADHIKAVVPSMEIDFSTLTKADNGYTIAEIFAQQATLANKEITLRAKVVKFSPNIMKTNWMHLQDGSGAAGTNDLTITTNATAAIGDTVLVTGILDLNQDFGYGYKYDVIIQKAQVTVE